MGARRLAVTSNPLARGLLAAAVLIGVVSCQGGPGGPDGPPNVLLITIDTLRADHLGAYGHPIETSPRIDALAARGTRFSDCAVQWPKTWPSIASLLTGAYPKTTGLRLKHSYLSESLVLMSEVFTNAGYATGAVVANFTVGKTYGFHQGFDHFVESWQDKWKEVAGDKTFKNATGLVKQYTNATIVTDQGLSWLRDGDHRPFFLWLHYMDPHGPYVPPSEYSSVFPDAYAAEMSTLAMVPNRQRQRTADGQVIRSLGFYKAQYDRLIKYLDDEIGRLLDELSRMGLIANTIIVFTADHGESLGEHGYYFRHGLLPYQPSAHIPLFIVHEGRVPQGRVIRQPVGLIDLPPTLMDLAGREIPITFEGQSLTALMKGDATMAPSHVFMESGMQTPSQLTVREGPWKLIKVRAPRDRRLMTGLAYELYDVSQDGAELTNLAGEYPEIVQRLARVLHDWYSGGPRLQSGREIDVDSLDPESIEMLRSLGYIN